MGTVKEPRAKTVFVVDDDEDYRHTCCEVLALTGYRTAAAANGKEALARLRSAPDVDLILLDLMMPVMNGWELQAELARDPQLSAIPVIVVTAGDTAADPGAAACLSKVAELPELLEAVRRHCR
jgi:two-component system, chemotaxis family, chemotaxis protein CheY